MSLVDPVLQGLVDSLNAAYGLCLDDGRLEEWPEFFVDDCLYQVIARENVDNGGSLAWFELELDPTDHI